MSDWAGLWIGFGIALFGLCIDNCVCELVKALKQKWDKPSSTG